MFNWLSKHGKSVSKNKIKIKFDDKYKLPIKLNYAIITIFDRNRNIGSIV